MPSRSCVAPTMCWGGVQDDFRTVYWKGAGTDLQDCDAEGPYPPIHERQTPRPRCLLWSGTVVATASAPRLLMAHSGNAFVLRRCPLSEAKPKLPCAASVEPIHVHALL